MVMAASHPERLDRLKALPLFAGIPAVQLAHVAEIATWEIVPAGVVVLRAGDEGSAVYVVVSGRFEVAVGQGPSRTSIAIVGEGELIGEAALFRRSVARSAEVRALKDAELLRLEAVDLDALRRAGNGVPQAIEEAVLVTLSRRIQASRDLVAQMLHGEEAPTAGFFSRLRGMIGR